MNSYGNVKTVVAMLYGLCIEDLLRDASDYDDEQFPIIFCVVLRKKDNSNE